MYIGIDVGGTNLKAGLVNEEGQILSSARTPLDFQSPEHFAEVLADLSRKVMAQGGVTEQDVEYVGIGIPGAVKGGEVVYTANIPMKMCPWRRCSGSIWISRSIWGMMQTVRRQENFSAAQARAAGISSW